jgi:hypothetical protein
MLKVISIELDGTLVKNNSRRWHHSLGNALWHTVSDGKANPLSYIAENQAGFVISPTTLEILHTIVPR